MGKLNKKEVMLNMDVGGETKQLKNENQNYKTNWKILQREYKSKPGIITCRLCLKEPLLILESGTNFINSRTELMQAPEQIFINKLESRQNLDQIIILGQNRFF